MQRTSDGRRSFLIVFEGIDGSGSSTQTERLTAFLSDQPGHRALATKQPSTGPAGAMIRLALDRRLKGPNRDYHEAAGAAPASSELDPATMALLFAADRVDHVSGVIAPSLERGRHVVCDRYLLSSLAYQGLHLDVEWLLAINRHARPADLTIFLDVPAEHTQRRMKGSRLTAELFEDRAQQERLRESYRRVIGLGHPLIGPVETVDAAQPIDAVAQQVQALVQARLLDGPPAAG